MTDTAAVPALKYLAGLGNHHQSEALPGALPAGQNSPQQAPFGLYAEQFSGTAFTVARAHNLRSWLYRLRPAAMHGAFRRIDDGQIRTAPHREAEAPPNRLRWDPPADPDAPADFIDGLATYAAGGDARLQLGTAVHRYACNSSMQARVFYDTDGELLIAPQLGALTIATEFGVLAIAPGEIAVVPRGVKFRVGVAGPSRGYVCENYGAPFRLPDLGLIGSNGLAAARDFLVPVASYEDKAGPVEVIAKFAGHLWAAQFAHSPLDVVAWHGNCVPYKYDLALFNVINTVSFDHTDPSIFTVLTSPSDAPGTANCDFVIFPPRWMVAENTFRPPYFHRNVMSEFMGLVRGEYDAKAGGFLPGGASLHNCMTAHGPDKASYDKAVAEALAPHRLANTLAVMFETRLILEPTAWSLASPTLQPGYDQVWSGFDSLGKLAE